MPALQTASLAVWLRFVVELRVLTLLEFSIPYHRCGAIPLLWQRTTTRCLRARRGR
jgi:hypothetical protein